MVKDSEVNAEMIARSDLLVIGSAADNTLLGVLAGKLGLSIGKDHFLWKGKVYCSADDGLILAYPNPYNPKKVVYLVVANSALQLYHMTKRHQPLPSWGLFSGEKIVERGYHVPEEMTIALQ